MIKIKINRIDEKLNFIEIKGHANFADSGSDIVCAAVSSAVLTSVNLMFRVNENLIDYQESDGYVLIKVLKHDEDDVLENLVDVLTELEKQYSKNIKIREEE